MEEKLSPHRSSHDFIRATALIVFVIILSWWILQPVQAQNGTLEYYQESLHNDPLERYVMQGDTIYLGKTYDLSGVSGITHLYAHWNNWKDENQDCSPDQIIDIWYIRTLTNDRAVFLDPEKWKTGNWFYWDQWECNISHYDYSQKKIITANAPLPADNKLVFKIINPPQTNNPEESTLQQVIIPIQGYQSPFNEKPAIIIPTTIPPQEPVQDQGWSWWFYAITICAGFFIIRKIW